MGAAFRQCRNNDDERHDRQILKQQYAHDLLTVRCIELGTLDQHLADDSGGGHGQYPAQSQSRAPVDLEEQRRKHDQHHGRGNLRRTQPEHQTLHRAQTRQAEFEADAEHQEHHAEFGQMPRLRRIGYPAQGVRADHDADQQISEHCGQVQNAAQHHHADGNGEQNEDEMERTGHALMISIIQ